MYHESTKQQRALQEALLAKRTQTDKNDADILNKMFDALLHFDKEMARELIVQPKCIKRLITQNMEGLVCFYSLHAIVLALIDDNCSDILNQMTDDDIATLKECITIAMGRERLAPEIIESHILKRKKEMENLKQYEKWVSSCMLQSLTISKEVNTEALWNDSKKQLAIWHDAIENFVRTQPQIPEATKTSETNDAQQTTLLTYKQIAQKLGLEKEAAVYDHIVRQIFGSRAEKISKLSTAELDEIRKWFVAAKYGSSKRYMLHSEYFDKYQKLFQNRRTRKVSPKHATRTQKSTTSQTPQQTTSATSQYTQLDVKALEKTLAAIVKMGQTAIENADKAVKQRQSIQDAIAKESDDNKIVELSAKLVKQNKEVIQKKSVAEKFKTAKDLYEKLQQAKASLDTTVATAIKFVESVQQK